MRHLALFAVLGFVAGDALADVPPPPPPKGKKYIEVTNSVAVEKSVKGYIFVSQTTSYRPAPVVSQLRVVMSDKLTKMPPGGRRISISLIALPEEEVKKIKGEAAIDEAIKQNKIPGMHRIDFASTDIIEEDYPNKSLAVEYTITEIDAKKGIIATIKRDGKVVEQKTKKAGDKPSDDGEQTSTRWPLVGAFSAMAIAMLGLWLVRRRPM